VIPRNTILQPRTPTYYPFKLPPLEPMKLVPFGDWIKTILRTSEAPTFLDFWNNRRRHAARLFQTATYDRLILSNSWASFRNHQRRQRHSHCHRDHHCLVTDAFYRMVEKL